MSFTHLRAASGYSLRYGASHPHALAERVAEWGLDALALTDRDSPAGAVRFAKACAGAGIRPLFGVDLAVPGVPVSGPGSAERQRTPARGGAFVTETPQRAVFLTRNERGWAELCRLVTAASDQGVTWEDLSCPEGELFVLLGADSERQRSHQPGVPLRQRASGEGFVLSTRRDVGAGLRSARLGRRTASDALARPFGFALRLHRATLLGFAAGLCLMGVMYGSILGEAADMVKNVEQLQEALKDIGGAGMAEAFASMVMVVVAVVASVYVVMAALRPRAEENAGRAEPLLATGLSRNRWLGSHIAVALTGGTALLVLAGLGFGVSGAASAGDGGLVLELTGAAAAYAPALWVTVGVAVLLFGWFPRAGAAAWIVPVYAFLVGYLGPILQLPDRMTNLSPFGHVPQLPAAATAWTPLLALTTVAAGLIALGLAGFRRRDLDTK